MALKSRNPLQVLTRHDEPNGLKKLFRCHLPRISTCGINGKRSTFVIHESISTWPRDYCTTGNPLENSHKGYFCCAVIRNIFSPLWQVSEKVHCLLQRLNSFPFYNGLSCSSKIDKQKARRYWKRKTWITTHCVSSPTRRQPALGGERTDSSSPFQQCPCCLLHS